MSAQKILIIEDEKKIADLIRDYLLNAGYDAVCIDRGDIAVSHVKKQEPDLILLDIMLPGKDGMEICRQVRSFSEIPIIMITAKVEEIDRILGLELGADDYICKPFSPREMVARVKAVLRRYSLNVSGKITSLGPIVLDEDKRQVKIDEKELKLTHSEYDLFSIMLKKPGKVFSRSELINRVQGYDFEGYERTIDSHIKNIRKKLAAYLPKHDIITSVYGVGYKLNFFRS